MQTSFIGYKNKKWYPINEKIFVDLEEIYDVKLNQIEIVDKNFSGLEKIKIVAQNQDDLPVWRKRKNKKPMIMIDEIELYNN